MVKERLLAEIRRRGPLPFERFMAAALYDPAGGYFTTGGVRSQVQGDFLTSPEVSPMFGEMLARFVEREHRRAAVPDGWTVVEVGAGSGSLLGPLLASCQVEVEAWAVEASPQARERLAEVVGRARVVETLGEVPAPLRGVVLANELADNLPMAVAVRQEGEWRERWVGAEGDELCLVDALVRPQVGAWLERFAGPVPEGGMVEVQLEAERWVQEALAMIEVGALVVIDYGDTAENLLPRRADGTLRTYRAHHLGPHPLDEPGATDITADVNFTALETAAREAGAEVELWRQDDFLADLGLRERLSQLRHRELELAREGNVMERLRVRSQRTEAETLLHPRGLGDFRVLVARKG